MRNACGATVSAHGSGSGRRLRAHHLRSLPSASMHRSLPSATTPGCSSNLLLGRSARLSAFLFIHIDHELVVDHAAGQGGLSILSIPSIFLI